MAQLNTCTVATAPTGQTDVVRKQDTAILVSTAPANGTDFTMFPGSVAPSAGLYLSLGADGKVWLFKAGNATWLYGQFGAP